MKTKVLALAIFLLLPVSAFAAWTVTLTNVERVGDDTVRASVSLSDGTTTVAKVYTVRSMDALKRLVLDDVARLDAGDALVGQLTPLLQKPVDTTITGNKTAEEAAAEAFVVKLGRLRAMTRAVELGIMTGNEAAFTNLKADIQKDLQTFPQFIRFF